MKSRIGTLLFSWTTPSSQAEPDHEVLSKHLSVCLTINWLHALSGLVRLFRLISWDQPVSDFELGVEKSSIKPVRYAKSTTLSPSD